MSWRKPAGTAGVGQHRPQGSGQIGRIKRHCEWRRRAAAATASGRRRTRCRVSRRPIRGRSSTSPRCAGSSASKRASQSVLRPSKESVCEVARSRFRQNERRRAGARTSFATGAETATAGFRLERPKGQCKQVVEREGGVGRQRAVDQPIEGGEEGSRNRPEPSNPSNSTYHSFCASDSSVAGKSSGKEKTREPAN